MSTATLRSIGGSIVVAIPKRILELVHLHTGSQVNIKVQNGGILVEPVKPHYSLEELMAQCDLSQPLSNEEREWIDNPMTGEEVY